MNMLRLMLLACIVLVTTKAKGEWTPKPGSLITRWTEDVKPGNVWTEYPRPQMKRPSWRNLNGLWQYSIRDTEESKPAEWDGEILVPFCVESALSGVMKRVSPNQALWYERSFELQPDWLQQQVLLQFGAVDWKAEIWVNGSFAGGHRGGYDPFTIDITELLRVGENSLTVKVLDPTDHGYQARGKQKLKPEGIWYTPITGIWQTVWLEQVPITYIRHLDLVPDLDSSSLLVAVHSSEEADVRISVHDGELQVADVQGTTHSPLALFL